jgi:histo-blood group ABO system transferase
MVSLLVVATGLYVEFLPSLLASARQHVKGLHRVFVLSERDPELGDPVTWLPWGHIAWPYPTLLRYRAFCAYRDVLEAEDVLLYVDVDMRFEREIDLRGIAGTIAVQHPGYTSSNSEGLPYERRPESQCSIPLGEGEQYYAGGVQGGRADSYLAACAKMAHWVQHDLSMGIIPKWHDESAWNKHCYVNPPALILSSLYCSPEYNHDPEASIVALDKDHDRLRQVPRRGHIVRYASTRLNWVRQALRHIKARYGT